MTRGRDASKPRGLDASFLLLGGLAFVVCVISALALASLAQEPGGEEDPLAFEVGSFVVAIVLAAGALGMARARHPRAASGAMALAWLALIVGAGTMLFVSG